MTRDPLASETGAPYSYSNSDPLNFIDPTGLSWYNPLSWCGSTWAKVGLGVGLTALALTGVGAIADAGIAAGAGAAEGLAAGAAEATGAAADAGAVAAAGTSVATTLANGTTVGGLLVGLAGAIKTCQQEPGSSNCAAGVVLEIGGTVVTLYAVKAALHPTLFWLAQLLGIGESQAGTRNYGSS